MIISTLRRTPPPKAVRDAGNVTIQSVQPRKVTRLTFSNYFKTLDSLAIEADLTRNRPICAKVKNYSESGKERETLTITFGTLNKNTAYPSDVTFEVKEKNLTVRVQNS